MTGDESWFHHFDPKKNDRTCTGIMTSSEKKMARNVPSAGKVTGIVFWDV
jgi:hypothetical protein